MQVVAKLSQNFDKAMDVYTQIKVLFDSFVLGVNFFLLLLFVVCYGECSLCKW